MKNLTQKFHQSNPILFKVTLIQIALFLISLIGLLVDTRTVSGINPWIKPIKFELSIALFYITFAYVLHFLSHEFKTYASRRFAICLMVEIVLIFVQAARGVGSHFNVSNGFDGAIFSIMGLVIAYNTYVVIRVLIEYIKNPPQIKTPLLKSIQYGVASVIIGSFLGAYMSSQTGHSVGVQDGGAGLPFLNWSTIAGDLRVAHFLGLHGIQILLIAGIFLSRKNHILEDRRAIAILQILFTLIIAITLFTFIQAILGQAFIPLTH